MEKITTQLFSEQVNRRITWIDFLKGISIIAVVLGHALLGYTENKSFGEWNESFLRLKDWIYIWHMPLFMCLSGFSFGLAYYRNNKLNIVRVKKQALNLALLYYLFSIILYGLKIPLAMFTDNKMSLRDALLNILLPNTIMWYLWVLAAFYFIFICCRTLINKIIVKPWITLGVLFLVAVAQKVSENFISWRLCFSNFVRLTFYFCFGLVLCIYRDKMKSRKSIRYVVIGTAVVMVHFVYYMKWTGDFKLFDSIVNEIIATLIILLIIEYASTYQSAFFTNGLLPAIGKASLVIYLLHTYIVTAMKVVFIRMGLCNGLLMDIIVLVLSTVIPISVCYFVDWVRRRNRVIGTIFSPVKLLRFK